MEELNNIWNPDDELNEEQLLNYIKNISTAKEAHDIEKQMADSSFVNDGIEGLQEFSSTEKINAYVQQVNQDLHNKLVTKKTKKKKGALNLSWEIIAVIVVILLCLLGFAVIQMLHH